MTQPKALTIAGSDSSGGAGIQADLKTFQDLGVYGMNALTTIVAMNPNGWSHNVFPQQASTVEAQLDTIFSIGVDAMKTGMLGSVDVIELAAKKIEEHNVQKSVVDPVLVCKGEERYFTQKQPTHYVKCWCRRLTLQPRTFLKLHNWLKLTRSQRLNK